MLLRKLNDGYLVIPQPFHARISGQLAAAWNDSFSPRDDIVLAAAIHDIGWCDEEKSLLLNDETGTPCDFLHLSKSKHINIWRNASQQALPFGRYVALLVSRHGTAIYNNFDFSTLSANDEKLVKYYLKEQLTFQEKLVASLSNDRKYSGYVEENILKENSKLILLWDLISIALCTGFDKIMPFKSDDYDLVPSADKLKATMKPWPFKDKAITVVIEGRKISGQFNSQSELNKAYLSADWHTIKMDITSEK